MTCISLARGSSRLFFADENSRQGFSSDVDWGVWGLGCFSYAGVYIPKLAQAILAANDEGGSVNLKGFAVGDACVGSDVLCGGGQGQSVWWDVVFFYGHGQFSTKLYNQLLETCTYESLFLGSPFVMLSAVPSAFCRGWVSRCPAGVNLSDECNALVAEMWTSIGGYYHYNL
jgi:hypothetical protein